MARRLQNQKVDPYEPRWGEVVLTGFAVDGTLCFQQVLTYEDYYEEVGHVFDRAESIARHGIRRLHLIVWNSWGRVQQEYENDYDETGGRVAGRRRDGPDEKWSEDKS